MVIIFNLVIIGLRRFMMFIQGTIHIILVTVIMLLPERLKAIVYVVFQIELMRFEVRGEKSQ